MSDVKVLIVDDEASIRRFLRVTLTSQAYIVFEAASGKDALMRATEDKPDIVILDLGLPDIDGIEVTRLLREWTQMPIIILSVRGSENDKIAALDAGADDYLTKPFGIAELMARIKTAFRHRGDPTVAPTQANFACDELEINFAKRRVTVAGKEITLTPTEYAMLQHLAVNSDKVLTHNMLLQSVWGNEYSSEKEYLRVFVGRLRRKLEPDPKNPKYIQTIPGVGYHLAALK